MCEVILGIVKLVTTQKIHQEHFAISSGRFCKIIEKIFCLSRYSSKASAEDVFKVSVIAKLNIQRSIMKS